MSMEIFLRAWKELGPIEGEYSNNPNDSGGPTRWGITEKVARVDGYTGGMREFPKERARQIAKHKYWDIIQLDTVGAMSENIAREMFDTGYNAGPPRAVRFLQRSLNALNRAGNDYPDQVVDGKMGSRTLSALDAFLRKRRRAGELAMLRALNGLQLVFYIKLVERREKDESFLFGWISHRIVI